MDYIIYTTEGYTQTPNGDDIDNCQILDIQYDSTLSKEEVLQQYLLQYPLLLTNFNKCEMKVALRVNENICESIEKLVAFVRENELSAKGDGVYEHLERLTDFFNL